MNTERLIVYNNCLPRKAGGAVMNAVARAVMTGRVCLNAKNTVTNARSTVTNGLMGSH